MKESIVIFSTTWGSRYGGIDSFNYDLCIALANLLRTQDSELKLVCILGEDNSTEEEIQVADSLGIERHCIRADIDSQFVIPFLESKVKPVCVLGHDVHTGQRAIDLARHYSVRSAVFHHMNYRAYRSTQATIRKQENILRASDIVFAIGPTLEDSAKSIINGFKDEDCVTKLIPGISSRQSIANKPPPNFSAITLGRVNLENDLVKQIKLAVASFGQAVREEPHTIKKKQPSLTVVGLSSEELEKAQEFLQELAREKANRHVSVIAWPYEKDRGVLFDELKNKTVCMVLSWYEGFSLVGLEAISAGVPLILSENTGLYNAIEEDFGGEGIGCIKHVDVSADEDISKNDLNQVKDCLSEIASDPAIAKSNAMKLREKLAKNWTWEKTAKQVLESISIKNNLLKDIKGISDSKTSSEISSRVKVEDENSLEDSFLISSNKVSQPFKKEIDTETINSSTSIDGQQKPLNKNEESRSKESEYTSQNSNITPLIPKEIISIRQKLLDALGIANTLQESQVISEAYAEYLLRNHLIVSDMLKSIVEMSFQVDLASRNTVLKLARTASVSYETSLKTVKGRKVTNQGKWRRTYQELLELKTHFSELFDFQ